MNYITLNGRRSDEITGLLIQSLPPIMKPLMRTDIEEIDGRDGDIVTKLGYSAYDREMLIGLHGKYNIDEVIEYFDSEGIAIFSNEPDKYYKYQILEQIDFERLARFRQATVTFHVQPFKFSSVDNKFLHSNSYIKAEPFTKTENSVKVTFDGEKLTVKGTPSANTSFMIPINCQCKNGQTYSVNSRGNGTGLVRVGFRVCQNAPSNPATLGYTLHYLSASEYSQTQTMTDNKNYNFLYVYCRSGIAIDLEAVITVTDTAYNSLLIVNRGNAVAKPIYKIYGIGTITFTLNGQSVKVSNLNSMEYIILDTAEMNATYGTTLKNRSIEGDLKNLWLKIGSNTLEWTGSVVKIETEEYSRWI